MELVPILSTIILVGTIATFILAVAAYILYKIRERRAREDSRQVAYQADQSHVLVAPHAASAIRQGEPAPASMYMAPSVPTQMVHPQQAHPQQQQPQQQQLPQGQNSLFWEYTDEGFVPVNPQEEQQQERPQAQAPQQQRQQPDEGYAWL
jgi:hypothetical protein